MKIGDKIRSFDFQPCIGRPLNYMEGIVWKIDDTFIWFNPTLVVRDGCPKGAELLKLLQNTTRTPKKGSVDNLFEYKGRITILKEAK